MAVLPFTCTVYGWTLEGILSLEFSLTIRINNTVMEILSAKPLCMLETISLGYILKDAHFKILTSYC